MRCCHARPRLRWVAAVAVIAAALLLSYSLLQPDAFRRFLSAIPGVGPNGRSPLLSLPSRLLPSTFFPFALFGNASAPGDRPMTRRTGDQNYNSVGKVRPFSG